MTILALAAAGRSSPFEAGSQAPVRRARLGGDRIATAALAAVALAAALSIALRGPGGGTATQTAIGRSPTSAVWIDIRKPQPLYSLAAPELARQAQSYEARRLVSGEARADTLAFGSFGGERAWLRLDIFRAKAGALHESPPFFVEIARRAAEAGLAVSKSALPVRLATRLGGMDLAGLTLERHGVEARCIGFRLADSGPGLRIAGLACPEAGKPITPGAAACLAERLQLVGGGDDEGLRGFFASAELRRDRFCSGAK